MWIMSKDPVPVMLQDSIWCPQVELVLSHLHKMAKPLTETLFLFHTSPPSLKVGPNTTAFGAYDQGTKYSGVKKKKKRSRKGLQILHLALCTKTQYHTVGKPYLHPTKTSNSSHILQVNDTLFTDKPCKKKPTCHLKNITIPQKNKYLQFIYTITNFTCPKALLKSTELSEARSTTWNTTF